jgi:methionyl aminopeptidase
MSPLHRTGNTLVPMNRLRSNDTCWCGSKKKFKRCHGDFSRSRRPAVRAGHVGAMRDVPSDIKAPDYVSTGNPGPPVIQQLAGDKLERMRIATRVAAEVLLEVGAAVRPGVTTDHLDAVAHAAYLNRGAYPSTLQYRGYRKSLCTSVNEVICHGIPDDRALADGDIVNLDITAFVEGMHGDTSATFLVGEVDPAVQALVETTREATYAGIAAVRPGAPVRVIGEAITALAHCRGFGVVKEYGGHGIGEVFHAAPHIPHHLERNATAVLLPGMCFTVEPMLTAGTAGLHQWNDGWTVVTDDGLPSAQFEHTVRVTDDGVEILTRTTAGRTAVG